ERKKVKPQAMFDFAFAKIVQIRLPMTILSKVICDVFGQENVASVAALDYALRDGDAAASDVNAIVYIWNLIHRAAVNSHPEFDLQSIAQSGGNFQCTANWLVEIFKKKQRHAVAGGQSNEFVFSFGRTKTLRP